MRQEDLAARFKRLSEWEEGDSWPTIKQLEDFARAVHVPIGYLFLSEPPKESLPVPDFRTFDSRPLAGVSPNLIDTLHSCQERQAWYREFAQLTQQMPRAFIGNATLLTAPEAAAHDIRQTLKFDVEARRLCATWADALRLFIQQADDAGILVMVSGVVLSNNRRKLDPEEFRGFALADPLAPLIFVNASDTKSGQMFTVAHELAHLWLNASGISNAGAAPVKGMPREEVWCNAVAAELLVPLAILRPLLHGERDLREVLALLTRHFKVSTLVILRRLLDVGWLSRDDFQRAWENERNRLRDVAARGSAGGNFYRTTVTRASRRFTRAIISSTLEGQTLYRDAFRLLGISKTRTFTELGREVGISA
jgi:Zn-dependent peptidase ImmA (M78 family)